MLVRATHAGLLGVQYGRAPHAPAWLQGSVCAAGGRVRMPAQRRTLQSARAPEGVPSIVLP